MLHYKLQELKNKKSEKNGWVYARALHTETISLDELVEHMASHNSPFSAGTIAGVLKDMVKCVREMLLESKKVKLDNLAIFSLGLKSTLAENDSSFNAAENIQGAHINATGTGSFSKKQLDLALKTKNTNY